MNSNQLYKSRLQTGEIQLITDDDLPLGFGGLLHPVSTVAELFGISEATLCKLIREVFRGIQ